MAKRRRGVAATTMQPLVDSISQEEQQPNLKIKETKLTHTHTPEFQQPSRDQQKRRCRDKPTHPQWPMLPLLCCCQGSDHGYPCSCRCRRQNHRMKPTAVGQQPPPDVESEVAVVSKEVGVGAGS
eukprot:718232-Pelagomonas_calceolata.AAC.1